MTLRSWLLPACTAAAVAAAVLLPQSFLLRWDRSYLDVLQEEPIDEGSLVTSYTLSSTERMHLLRYSGIEARGGEIRYGSCGGGITLEVKTLDEETMAGSVGDIVYNYLYDGLYYLAEYNAVSEELLLHYQQSHSTVEVDYCTVADGSDPFFSMTLLCLSVMLEDGAAYGLTENTAFSVVLDEETGVVYALSIRGDPALALTENPLRYAVLSDLIGVSFTEYGEFYGTEENYPSARFNFGGYSYILEQKMENGEGMLAFNLENR